MVSKLWPPKDYRNKHPPWFSMQALQETRLLGPYFLHHIWLGLFTMISYETSFQSCCKVKTCRLLGFIYGSCIMVFHIFFLQLENSWTRCFLNNGLGQGRPTAWPAPSDLNPLDFYLWGQLKTTVYATEVSDVQDWQQCLQNGCEMTCMMPNFPASWAITVQTCKVLHWSRQWTICTFSLIFKRPQLINQLQKSYVHKAIFSCSVVQIHLLYVWSYIFCSTCIT
jgi:hypothetical protein